MNEMFNRVKEFMDFSGMDYCHINDFIMFLDKEMADTDFTLELISCLLISLKEQNEGCPEDMEDFKKEVEGILQDVIKQ
ncbi:hypothetical protein VP14_222 [Vibrio phage VPMCC14]|nr:hypothetical protein VP14_222 [Vibrio phage VPMCC14]